MLKTSGRSGRAAVVSLILASGVVSAWVALHIYSLWYLDAPAAPGLAVLCLIGLTWLSSGLFIIAHDAMHGAVVPGWPRVNRWIGTVMLALYAGFSWRRLIVKHMAHHRHPGTEDDPDFGEGGPLRWYIGFVRTYFGLREALVLTVAVLLYAWALGPRWPYVVFWSLPSILASMQLFIFGTWLPHRPGHDAFPDRHNARSTRLSKSLSLLSCFHFGGYHHEHHLHPSVPWWQLPATRPEEKA